MRKLLVLALLAPTHLTAQEATCDSAHWEAAAREAVRQLGVAQTVEAAACVTPDSEQCEEAKYDVLSQRFLLYAAKHALSTEECKKDIN